MDFVKSPNIKFQVSNFYVSGDVSYDTRTDMTNLNVDFLGHYEISDHTNNL